MPNLQLCVDNLNSSEGRSSGPRDGRTFPASTDNIGEGIQRVLQNITKYGLPVRSDRKEIMVYVLAKDGRPLMPTKHHGKVRHLLENGKAVCVRRAPFTIRLLYDTPGRTQPVSLGIDAGSKMVGLSACTEKEELFAAECELRTDINKNLEQRRSLRRTRRNRKTRYRKPRFLNRTKSKKKGWLVPSVAEKANSHLALIRKMCSILPISEITIEMAPFDSQKLKAQLAGKDLPSGTGYQHGETEGFDNIKAYVKWRDGGKCCICGSHEMLQIHHRMQRREGGSNRPDNLICVCGKCHKAFHAGKLTGRHAELMLPGKALRPMNDAAFMSIMRWHVWNGLKQSGIPCHMTYGYITAERRKQYSIEKSHHADARCISGHGNAIPASEWFALKKVRRHNRQIHKLKILPGGIRKRNQAAYVVKGFRLFDKVRFHGQECFIFGRRSSGSFVVRTLDGTTISPCAGYRKLTLIEKASGYLWERRTA